MNFKVRVQKGSSSLLYQIASYLRTVFNLERTDTELLIFERITVNTWE